MAQGDITKEFEILVVSNGSSVNSISKIDELLKNYNNTKHIVLKEKLYEFSDNFWWFWLLRQVLS